METARCLTSSDQGSRQMLIGLRAALYSLANDLRGMSSSKREALVSHLEQAAALALDWTFERQLGTLYFSKLSHLLCHCWQLGSSMAGEEEREHV